MNNLPITKRPLRVIVTQLGYRPGKVYKGRGKSHRGAYTHVNPVTYGFVAWTPDTTAEPWREGYGSFLFGSIHATRAEVLRHLASAKTQQIQIRTNQDRCLFVINRRADGSSAIYRACEN